MKGIYRLAGAEVGIASPSWKTEQSRHSKIMCIFRCMDKRPGFSGLAKELLGNYVFQCCHRHSLAIHVQACTPHPRVRASEPQINQWRCSAYFHSVNAVIRGPSAISQMQSSRHRIAPCSVSWILSTLFDGCEVVLFWNVMPERSE